MNKKINLIRTKLIAPIPRKNYLKREKIIDRLNNICDYKITVVKGEAGSGKSTLLSSFVIDKKLPNVKWINLSEDNNGIYSFWYYFIEAVKDYILNESEKIISSLNGMTNEENMLSIITYIINEIALEKDIIIVFDDYHYIKEEVLNYTVEYLVKYSPSNVHYVFLTREEMPFYLGEFRVRDELLEIGENDLKFSKEECTSFIKNTLKFDLSEESVDKIFNVSEGWIGGIQLTALAMKNKGDIKKIEVLNKYVIEYLTKEILSELSDEERNFLIKTSILSYFDEGISNYILQIDNSKEIIESIINKNLFVITIDEEENIFRYHHLFRDFLNINFKKLDEDEKREIHLRAYSYLKDNGDIGEGIAHLLKIQEYDEVMAEIEKNISNMKVRAYIKYIPLKNLIKSNELIIQRIFYHFANLQGNKCKEVIEYIDRNGSKDIKSMSNLAKIYVYNYHSSINEEDLRLVEKLKLSDFTRAIMYLNIFPILLKNDQYEKVMRYGLESDEIAKRYNMTFLSVFAKAQLANVFEEMGEFDKTLEMYNEIKSIVSKSKFANNLKFMYYLGAAGIYMKRYEIDKTEQCLRIVSMGLNSNVSSIKRGILYNIMELNFIKGDIEKGRELADELMEKYPAIQSYIPCNVFAAKLKYLIPQGYYKEAELKKFKELIEDKLKNSSIYIMVEDKIIYARVLYLFSERDKALKIIDEALEYCRKYSIKTHLVEGILIKALNIKEDSVSKKREKINLVREAIYYSVENSYLRPFILEGEKLVKILNEITCDSQLELTSKENEFIKRIIYIEELNKDKKGNLLSEREREVLGVMAQGHSNREIGEILNISLATVKTHVINIYSKLQVSNRVMAVEKAKKLKLV